jgi:hypothetical protein
VPISVLLVLAAIASREEGYAFERAIVTVIGACVGVIVSLALPASRLTDARQTIGRLGDTLGGLLEAMAEGLLTPWGPDQTADWRRRARTARERLVAETEEAVGSGREAARWNLRDRRHIEQLGRFEETLPRLERTAIGVSVISRGLDDHARLVEPGTLHRPMPDMSALLGALGVAVRAVVRQVLGECTEAEVNRALDDVRLKRVPVARAAFRQARQALDQAAAEGTLTPRSLPVLPAGASPADAAAAAAAMQAELDAEDRHEEGEWLSYAALLVQVDRIVGDLSAPLPP